MLVDGKEEEEGGGYHYCGRLERDAPEIDGQVTVDAADSDTGIDGQESADPVGRFAEVEVTEAHPYELAARFVGRHW